MPTPRHPDRVGIAPERRHAGWRPPRSAHPEARALAAQGEQLLQIDEPFLAGYPEDVGVT